MKTQPFFLLSLLASALACPTRAEEVAITAEKAVVITFPSQAHRAYKLLAAQSAAGDWTMLRDGIVGTGGEVTIFYKSESDQKLFFKVETSDGPPGQRSLLSLANLDVSGENLSGYDLEGADLRGFKFQSTQFDGANLIAANISDGDFTAADFAGADLRHAVAAQVNMQRATFTNANLEGIRFERGNVSRADFRGANLKGVVFAGTELEGANFAGVTLTNFSFRAAVGAALDQVDFSGANLSGADLSRNSAHGTKFQNANLSGANLEGVSFQYLDMKGHDLRTAFLRGIAAIYGDWTDVNAAGTDLSLAYLGPALFLDRANFAGAQLEGVTLAPDLHTRRGVITNANFRGASLKGAFLRSFSFKDCDFTGADLSFADLTEAGFHGSIGLDTNQPGTIFNSTALPDGSFRTGTNPGASTAPGLVPPRLQLVLEGHDTQTLEFTPRTTQPYPPGPSYDGTFRVNGGTEEGTYNYSALGHIASLELGHSAFPTPWGSPGNLKLRFTSTTAGEVFRAEHESATREATYLIGSFTVPQ